jgi:phage anti-repressor protein/very-short-patch-repair endonuclease
MVKQINNSDLINLEFTNEEIELINKYQVIIPINYNENYMSYYIDARTLWDALEKPHGRFSTWIQRMFSKYVLVQNEDFYEYDRFLKQGGRAHEYSLSINTSILMCKSVRYSLSVCDVQKYLHLINKLIYNDESDIVIYREHRPEIIFGDMLDEITGLKWERQYPIDGGKYRLDFYLKDELIVEYDETHHQWHTKEDDKRIRYCREWLKCEEELVSLDWWCPVIRVKIGKENEGIRKILRHLIYSGFYEDFYEKDSSIYDYDFAIL